MFKIGTSLLLGFLVSGGAWADIVNVDNVRISEVSVYDDFEGGIVRLQMSETHPSCPDGSYLKPGSEGFDRLYSLVLVQASADKAAKFQLYDDRNIGGLCQVDAIRLKF